MKALGWVALLAGVLTVIALWLVTQRNEPAGGRANLEASRPPHVEVPPQPASAPKPGLQAWIYPDNNIHSRSKGPGKRRKERPRTPGVDREHFTTRAPYPDVCKWYAKRTEMYVPDAPLPGVDRPSNIGKAGTANGQNSANYISDPDYREALFTYRDTDAVLIVLVSRGRNSKWTNVTLERRTFSP